MTPQTARKASIDEDLVAEGDERLFVLLEGPVARDVAAAVKPGPVARVVPEQARHIAKAIADNVLGGVHPLVGHANAFWLEPGDARKTSAAFEILRHVRGISRLSLIPVSSGIEGFWPKWSAKEVLPNLSADQISLEFRMCVDKA